MRILPVARSPSAQPNLQPAAQRNYRKPQNIRGLDGLVQLIQYHQQQGHLPPVIAIPETVSHQRVHDDLSAPGLYDIPPQELLAQLTSFQRLALMRALQRQNIPFTVGEHTRKLLIEAGNAALDGKTLRLTDPNPYLQSQEEMLKALERIASEHKGRIRISRSVAARNNPKKLIPQVMDEEEARRLHTALYSYFSNVEHPLATLEQQLKARGVTVVYPRKDWTRIPTVEETAKMLIHNFGKGKTVELPRSLLKTMTAMGLDDLERALAFHPSEVWMKEVRKTHQIVWPEGMPPNIQRQRPTPDELADRILAEQGGHVVLQVPIKTNEEPFKYMLVSHGPAFVRACRAKGVAIYWTPKRPAGMDNDHDRFSTLLGLAGHQIKPDELEKVFQEELGPLSKLSTKFEHNYWVLAHVAGKQVDPRDLLLPPATAAIKYGFVSKASRRELAASILERHGIMPGSKLASQYSGQTIGQLVEPWMRIDHRCIAQHMGPGITIQIRKIQKDYSIKVIPGALIALNHQEQFNEFLGWLQERFSLGSPATGYLRTVTGETLPASVILKYTGKGPVHIEKHAGEVSQKLRELGGIEVTIENEVREAEAPRAVPRVEVPVLPALPSANKLSNKALKKLAKKQRWEEERKAQRRK